RRFLESHCPPTLPRRYLDAGEEVLPEFWPELAKQGWLGLPIEEGFGGQGYGLVELAVVLEELGWALAPGPFLSSALAAVLIQECGDEQLKARVLPSIVD